MGRTTLDDGIKDGDFDLGPLETDCVPALWCETVYKLQELGELGSGLPAKEAPVEAYKHGMLATPFDKPDACVLRYADEASQVCIQSAVRDRPFTIPRHINRW